MYRCVYRVRTIVVAVVVVVVRFFRFVIITESPPSGGHISTDRSVNSSFFVNIRKIYDNQQFFLKQFTHPFYMHHIYESKIEISVCYPVFVYL